MPVQFPAVIELSDLDGSNGFIINGVTSDDKSGQSVNSAGDINNDGIPDLIIGAWGAPNGADVGQSYVIFGGPSIGSSGIFELASLDGNNGFVMNGFQSNGYSGYSVNGAGDINNDGVADLIVGAYWSLGFSGSGQSYVVFGGENVASSGVLDLASLDGQNGFAITGNNGDRSGYSVSTAGDVNADGVDDLLIGAFGANSGTWSARNYVVFGGLGVGINGTVDLASINGHNGFIMKGVVYTPFDVGAVGDINADGTADLIIGSMNARPNGLPHSGQSYAIFGSSDPVGGGTILLESLNGGNGFKLNGVNSNDYSGRSVSGAGDINADGHPDLIIGAPGGSNIGQSYVVFGGVGIGSSGTFELASLNGDNGFVLNGTAAGDYCGISVSAAGDINADGIDDLIIGASGADPNGSKSGQSYVVFGGIDIGESGTFEFRNLNGRNGVTLNGIASDDQSGFSVSAASDINHDGVDDLIIGAPYANPHGTSSGQSYVVFGDHIALGNNELTITKGVTVILSENNLNATSINHNDALLRFQISAIQQGQFEFVSNPSIPITYFYQQNITDSQVQFVQNGSDNPPSYEVTAFTDMWANTGAQAATINFAPILLVNNNANINQGGVYILSSANLSATDSAAPDNTLLFTVSEVEHGHFEGVDLPGVVITSFIQQKILDQKIQFIQDGSPNVPSYDICVSDGIYSTPPTAATISFNYLPVLETNNLSIGQGQELALSPNNLKASDPDTSAKELIFSISVLQNGRFSFTSNANVPITQFTQGQVDLGTVQFIHDGSPNAPSYNVTVSDAALTTTPDAATINWEPTQQFASKTDHTARNTLLGTFLSVGAVSSLLLCYISMGFLKNRRLKAVGERDNEEQAHFYQAVIIPIARAVFKQIKVTGFMNYISMSQMEAYVAEIATVVSDINQLGIHVELQDMDVDHQTQLLNEIVKQMKRHLGIQSGICNRVWFTGIFKPQIKPEMIGQKAERIASSVYAALMGIPDEDFDEVELSKMSLLTGDYRRDSMNSKDYNDPMAEIARLQNLLEEREQQHQAENDRLRELLKQQGVDEDFTSTTSYVKFG